MVMNQQSYTLLDPDTRNPLAVAGAVEKLHEAMFPGVAAPYIQPIMGKMVDLFAGRWGDYQAMDTAYHDLEHTLQATLCGLRILAGPTSAPRPIPTSPRAISASPTTPSLLHDVGYLKKRGDHEGTGAKYTLIHEPRGCEMAHDFLAEENWDPAEVERVCSLILCTGPRSNLGGTKFGNPAHRLLGQAVCTADFLSQMSDPGYVQKLPDLFEEFSESDRANHIPAEQRQFKTLGDLYRNTPRFGKISSSPNSTANARTSAATSPIPFPDGPNPYFEQIQAQHRRHQAHRLPLPGQPHPDGEKCVMTGGSLFCKSQETGIRACARSRALPGNFEHHGAFLEFGEFLAQAAEALRRGEGKCFLVVLAFEAGVERLVVLVVNEIGQHGDEVEVLRLVIIVLVFEGREAGLVGLEAVFFEGGGFFARNFVEREVVEQRVGDVARSGDRPFARRKSRGVCARGQWSRRRGRSAAVSRNW